MDDITSYSMIKNCPNCAAHIASPAEAAAHVCPTEKSSAEGRDPTALEIAQAAQATKIQAAMRAAKLPSPQNLAADAKTLVQAVIDGWDQDVEVVVALVPKGSQAINMAAYTVDNERTRWILKTLLQRRSEELRKV